MKKLTLIIVIVLLVANTFAQEKDKQFGIKFSGFVKSDFFFDSRQTVSAREGHFLLWPSAESLDSRAVDINDKSNFNFLSVQSRLTGAISGPDAFGAKTSGLIEGDFFAQANDNINLFRLRHAFIKLNWEKTEILAGQYWNPLFVTSCFPGTISFNTGTPLQSFARNPQVRLTQTYGDFSIIVAALAQRDYTSRGPDPANNAVTKVSSEFLRNSSIPDMHFQLHYNIKSAESAIVLGTGIAYKTIVPRLASVVAANSYAVDETLSSLTAIAFSKITLKNITIKLQARYGENISDLLSISGFAVKSIINPITGEVDYTPLKNSTVWGEIHSNGSKVQVGIFGGYLKNLGTKEEMSSVSNSVYGLGTNIESLLRVAPRIVFISSKTRLACELEYTSAAYGSNYNRFYVPANTTTVSNLRVLFSAIYAF